MRSQSLNRSYLLVSIVAIVTATNAASLAPRALAQATKPATPASYPDESIVIERSDTVYTYAADGTGTAERTIVARVQSDAAVRSLGVVSVAYAANSQKLEFLYARVRRPDGTVIDTPPSDAIEMPAPVTREAPLYSDLKEKQIPIRSLRAGDTLEWKSRTTTIKAEAPGQFWGQDSFVENAVVLSESLELRVPAGSSINVWSPTAKPVESVADGLHIYRWTSSQLKPTTGKQADADAEAKKKKVMTADEEVDADQGKLPAVAWTTFKSWADVGAWYRTLQTDRITPSPEIKARVAELIAGKTTDEEKVRILYAYVASQIHYIGVDFGIGRYQPHTAAEILANQYGDCKDKHTLLASMLSAAGIASDAVLIGAGIRFNEAVPSPGSFNHVITHLTLAGQPVWLDATAEIAPYRMLFAAIRDKQALVVPVAAAAHVDRTPLDPPFASFQNMDADGSIDKDGLSHSRLSFTVRGDTELIVRNAFHEVSPGQYNQVVQQISRGIGYSGTTSNAEVSRPDDTAAPFKMAYDYEREKAGDWDHLQIVPQVAPISLPRFADTDPLIRSLDLGTPRIELSKASIKIPEGWTAVLPEASHHKCAYATYDETYRFEKGVIYTERRVEILKAKVPTSDLKTYKKWADDAGLGDELYVQLIRHDSDTPSATSTTAAVPTPANPGTDVEKLIEQAFVYMQKLDLYNAKELIDQARKLSPEHPGVWFASGALHYRNGEMALALADYKKELELHPSEFQRVYPVIIGLQSVSGQHKEAMDSLRGWIKADPNDPSPVSQLLNMLIENGDGKTAVVEGEAAFKHLPEATDGRNDYARIALGQSYILVGDKLKGAAALETVLEDSQDAGTLNDAAYTLADASLDLQLADKSVRASLAKLDEESNTWTLDEDPQTLAAKTQLIVAAWDTLGWTLFREGKLDDAQSYLQAAWLGLPNLDTGKHLGDLQLARGDKAAALAAYDLAVASAPTYDAMGVRTEPTEKQKKVQAQADGLRRPGAKPAAADPRSIQALRVIPLGSADGRAGQAEYRILMKAGKAVKIEPVGDKKIAGADDLVTKANLSRYFPAGSQAALARTAYVNCHSKVCELVLGP